MVIASLVTQGHRQWDGSTRYSTDELLLVIYHLSRTISEAGKHKIIDDYLISEVLEYPKPQFS